MRNMLKSKCGAYAENIVFRQAAQSLETAVIPAAQPRRFGALSMVPRAYDAPRVRANQRAKIWVR